MRYRLIVTLPRQPSYGVERVRLVFHASDWEVAKRVAANFLRTNGLDGPSVRSTLTEIGRKERLTKEEA